MNLKVKVFAMLVIVPLLGFSQVLDLTPIVYKDYLCFDPLQSRYIEKELTVKYAKDSLTRKLIADDLSKDSLLVTKDEIIKDQDQKLKNCKVLNSSYDTTIEGQEGIIKNQKKSIKLLRWTRKLLLIGGTMVEVVSVVVVVLVLIKNK